MASIFILPVEITNQFGNQKYIIRIPMYKTSSDVTSYTITEVGTSILECLSEISVVSHTVPLLLIKFNQEKENGLIKKWKFDRLFPKYRTGISIDIAKALNESPWKFQLMGNLQATPLRPGVAPSIGEDYPLYKF